MGKYFGITRAGKGAYDDNMEKYIPKQRELALELTSLTNKNIIETKEQFDVFDGYVCGPVNPNKWVKLYGYINMIPFQPYGYEDVQGNVELKSRDCLSTDYDSSLIDTHKLERLCMITVFQKVPCWIIWKYQDKNMYYRVDPSDIKLFNFPHLGFNGKTAKRDSNGNVLPWEYKPQSLIPIEFLTECTPGMFDGPRFPKNASATPVPKFKTEIL